MKGGQVPIHIMRVAVADYLHDPWVMLALNQNNLAASAFYPLFLFHSFLHGGELPSDPALLSAVVKMRRSDVIKALAFWTHPACGLVQVAGGKAWNPRVKRDVEKELGFRAQQAEFGRLSAEARKKKIAPGEPEGSLNPPPLNPPAPSPSPAPTPAPNPTDTPGRAAGRAGGTPPTAPAATRPPGGPGGGNGGPTGPLLDHDPTDPLEARVAGRVAHLAGRIASADGREATQSDALEVLAAVSGTREGKTLDHVRGAGESWLEATVRGCDEFERDLGGTDAEDETQERGPKSPEEE